MASLLWLFHRCMDRFLTGGSATMHHIHRMGEKYGILFKDHDHFALGHKVQILDIQRGNRWCHFVTLDCHSGFLTPRKSQ